MGHSVAAETSGEHRTDLVASHSEVAVYNQLNEHWPQNHIIMTSDYTLMKYNHEYCITFLLPDPQKYP